MINSRTQPRGKPFPKPPPYLSDLQVRQLISRELELRNQILLELFAHCGIHRCEAATLEIARIDYEQRQFTVAAPGYGGHRVFREVPLPDSLAAKLKKWIGRRVHGYVFPGRDGPHLTTRAIQDVVRFAGARIELPPGVKVLTTMILRHTCAQRLLAMGMDYEGATKILGLANLARVVRRYPLQSYEEVKGQFLATMS